MSASDSYGASSSLQDDDLGDIDRPVYENEDDDSLKAISSLSAQSSSSKKPAASKRGGRGAGRAKRSNEQIYETKSKKDIGAPVSGSVSRKAGRTKAHEPTIVAMEAKLNDDQEELGSDTPIMDSIDPIAIFHGLPGTAFDPILFQHYPGFDYVFMNYYLNIDESNNNTWSITRTKQKKSMNLKNIGHHVIILNYSRTKNAKTGETDKTPLIFGLNQQKLPPTSEETLKIYEFENKIFTASNYDVKMYIITTKKKFAVIMFERILQCPDISSVTLKKPDMWIRTMDPRKV